MAHIEGGNERLTRLTARSDTSSSWLVVVVMTAATVGGVAAGRPHVPLRLPPRRVLVEVPHDASSQRRQPMHVWTGWMVASATAVNTTATVGPFSTPGAYHVYCTIHPGMTLTILVQ
jgi:hypothetical protein